MTDKNELEERVLGDCNKQNVIFGVVSLFFYIFSVFYDFQWGLCFLNWGTLLNAKTSSKSEFQVIVGNRR